MSDTYTRHTAGMILAMHISLTTEGHLQSEELTNLDPAKVIRI